MSEQDKREVTHQHEVGAVLQKFDSALWMVNRRMVDVDTDETLYELQEVGDDSFSEIVRAPAVADNFETPPEPSEMSVEELREEYRTYDVAALANEPADERWERTLSLWRELESRDLVEFPECSREGCDCRRWRFTPGGPASCAECGEQVHDAEQSEKVHGAAKRLIHGGETA